MNFCHLHVHNEYSVLDGVGTSKQYAELAKELGQTAIAITNHANIDGAIEHRAVSKSAMVMDSDSVGRCRAGASANGNFSGDQAGRGLYRTSFGGHLF